MKFETVSDEEFLKRVKKLYEEGKGNEKSGAGHVKMPYGVVETPTLPEGLEQFDAKEKYEEVDASSLNYADDNMLTTTMPMCFSTTGEYLGFPPNVDVDGQSECLITGYLKRKIALTPGIGSPLPRVEAKTHQIVDAPGQGVGMFAYRNIAAGELILAERPLLVLPSVARMIRQQPANAPELTPAQTMRIMQEDTEKLYELAVERMQPGRREAFEKLKNSHLHDGSGPIMGRMRTNGFGFEEMRDLPRNGKPGETFVIICDELSRLNHSCGPNTHRYWDMATFSVQMRAIRDIKKDEEITATYCQDMESFEKRKKNLAPYDFQCACPACIDPKTSDARRKQIHAVVMANGLGFFWEKNFEVPKKTVVKPLLDAVGLCEKEGLESTIEHGFLLFVLMKTYAAKGDVANMRVYARRYSVWRLACLGTAVDEDEVEKGFGLVTVAEMVQRMKGRMLSGGKAKKTQAK
ncbi:hypothetical protein EIP91_000325 [Steccherinum ochraceum]|uniref:SET domain-containing protein n=1 Tax=Steccherinum ochraceum TaxID=92696 RepID=A0A4R0RTZ1_9APHY|nr:hypothetical protein EIP91_000325 [Steccherinum ochraceum]